jgi:putative Mg2+ transporter-C (MgtC) family protein
MFSTPGQTWLQLEELGLAFVLSSFVGLERELRQKSAGLRTYALVGVSAALFMLISKYGFGDVLTPERVVVDPSRVAAQIVSGIGFIGGGVIFMRDDIVRGLTTAASVWLTAALGMACGAGLTVLAIATTVAHIVIMFVFPRLLRFMPRAVATDARLTIAYQDGRGLLRQILVEASRLAFTIDGVEIERDSTLFMHQGRLRHADAMSVLPDDAPERIVVLHARIKGRRPLARLFEALSRIDGVVNIADSSETESFE